MAAVLITAVITVLASGLMAGYAMRVAERNQLIAQERVIAEWPGFEVAGGTNRPVGPTRSAHLIYGTLDGAAVEVELVVIGKTAEIVALRPFTAPEP